MIIQYFKMDTLHFTIGEGFGEILTNIAQETLLYDFNLKKAIKVIKNSLVGIDETMAFRVLLGHYFIEEDVEAQEIIVDTKNISRLIKFDNIQKKVSIFSKELTLARSFLATEGTKAPTIDIYYGRGELNKYFREENVKAITDVVDREFSVYAGAIKLSMDILDKSVRQFKVWGDIIRKGKELDVQVGFTAEDIELPESFYELHRMIQTPDAAIEEKITYIDALEDYMDDVRKIDGISLEGIKPVDILEGYDAGWLAPNGDYYGLNGDIALMLHNQIADMLVDVGVIPEDFENSVNETEWLEQNGWVKQHGNWILYAGYERAELGEKDVPITKEQIDKLYRFGQTCHKGILKLGYRMERISASNLPLIDPIMFKTKWFKI